MAIELSFEAIPISELLTIPFFSWRIDSSPTEIPLSLQSDNSILNILIERCKSKKVN